MVAHGVDAYSGALPGYHLDVVRTGAGFGPNTARSVSSSNATLTSGSIGFPILGRTNVANDRIVMALVTSAPPGSRWCEIDLEPGTVLLYGPETEHVGISPAGLAFVVITVRLESVEKAADRLELRRPRIPRGHVDSIAREADVRLLAGALQTFQYSPFPDSVATAVLNNTVEALATVLSPESAVGEAKRRRKIDNRQILRHSIQHAHAVGRTPSVTELSRAAFVSERRLREAFTSTLGMPPHRYFRYRGLTVARDSWLPAMQNI